MRRLFALLPAAILCLAACSDGGEEAPPHYGVSGPYSVGVTFLALPDGRPVDVWYPAAEGGEIADPFVYNLNDFWPESIATAVPPAPNIVVDAYEDVAASGEGPFPVVLESHGLASTRQDGSLNHRQLASWGFIVVAPEHYERNRATVVGQPEEFTEMESVDVLLAALDLVVAESLRAGSILEGRVDDTRIAVDGISAGGEAALELAADPRIGAVVARAPAGPGGEIAAPVMVIASDRDVAVPVDDVLALYAGLPAPKALAVLENAGHNTFTDSCAVIRDEGGIPVDELSEATGFPPALLEFGNNGCTEDYVDPDVVKPVIDHLRIAHIRWAFGIDETDEQLQPAFVSDTFPNLLAEYQFAPE